jgi:hypothetical protein
MDDPTAERETIMEPFAKLFSSTRSIAGSLVFPIAVARSPARALTEHFLEPQSSLTGGAHHNDHLTGATKRSGGHLHRHIPK